MRRVVTLCTLIAAVPYLLKEYGSPIELLTTLSTFRPAKELVRHIKSKAPELFVDLEQVLGAWGYPLETHAVTTEDGYVLGLHRIPRGRNGAKNPVQRPPVLLLHGFLGCSEQWVLGGPGIAPALTLVDHGYDVWMGNIRGNHYSRKHKFLSPESERFWIFSWHEIGVFDVPAMIDYVLQATQRQELFYMGHSMGNLALYVAASARPDVSAKVRLQVALGPVVFCQHSTSLVMRFLAQNWKYFKAPVGLLSTYEVGRSDFMWTLYHILCSEKAFLSKLCAVIYGTITGNTDLKNITGQSYRLARSTSSTSWLLLFNYGQIFNEAVADTVRSLDYGADENLRVYGSAQPPEYQLRRFNAPTALYVAQDDHLASPKDVKQLAEFLPNVISLRIITEEFFNHEGFFYHSTVNEVLMNHVLKLMKQF